MTQSSKLNSDQLYYLREVLGIESVIAPSVDQAATPALIEMPVYIETGLEMSFETQFSAGEVVSEFRSSGDQNAAKVIVLIANDDASFPLDGESGELTRKMIQAMKYPSSHTFIVEWNHARSGQAPEGVRELIEMDPKPALIFGTNTARSLIGENPSIGVWTTWHGTRLVVTEHPTTLLRDPEKKKIAWAHMQTFMKGLS